MSFANLKKQSSLGSLTARLVQEVEKLNKTASSSDDRFWKIERDKSGNGYAVIRFLPPPDGEDDSFVQVWSHAFQGPGGWYIENSLTTLGRKDPVSEMNRELWNTGNKSDQEVVRQRKRKLSYYSNIYVVKDPVHPENEGKVFLFKYGKKIFEKITSALKPEFEDETPIDAFDLWKGANFKLKVRMADGYPNYDKSEFDSSAVLANLDDEELEAIWKKEYSLKEFVAEQNFKTYEQLETRLNSVLNKKSQPVPRDESFDNEEEDLQPVSTSRPVSNSLEINETEEDDDTLSYFQRLAED